MVPRRAACLTAATLLILVRPPTIAAQAPVSAQPLSELERVVHLLNRATYGPRPLEVEEVLSTGRDAWLERQLNPERIWVRPFVASLPTHQQRVAPDGSSMDAPQDGGEANLMELERRATVMIESGGSPIPVAQLSLKVQRALSSPRQLEELLTDFWFNHFNVSYAKAQVRAAIVDYEAVAIRPYVFRRFEDMLIETARHPAMLMYLDNYLSRAASPEEAPTAGGINENYARELLELHTLGVDGGYTQQDVIEVARAFTGWTVPMRPGARGGPPQIVTGARIPFEFLTDWHDRGEKVVLGQTLPAGRGMEDGFDVLRILARHPSTARHLSTKLVRHFVSDEPSPALVDEIARVFLESDGDLRAVYRALFTSELFYERANFQTKTKRPFELVVSVLRATGGDLELREANLQQQRTGIAQRLRALEHVPYTAVEPTGFPVTSEEWVSAGAMLERMNLSLDIASGRLPGVKVDPWGAIDEQSAAALRGAEVRTAGELNAGIVSAVLRNLFHGLEPAGLHVLISESLSEQDVTEPSELVSRAVALGVASPHFQRY